MLTAVDLLTAAAGLAVSLIVLWLVAEMVSTRPVSPVPCAPPGYLPRHTGRRHRVPVQIEGPGR